MVYAIGGGMRSCLLLSALFPLICASPAHASTIFFPSGADTQSQISQSLDNAVWTYPINIGTFQTLTTTNGPNSAFAEVDFAAGTLKSSIDNQIGGGSSVHAWEFVAFNIAGGGSTNVSWSLDYDGIMSSFPSTSAYVRAYLQALIFDVTDNTVYFDQFPSGVQVTHPALPVSCATLEGVVEGSIGNYNVTSSCIFNNNDTADIRINSDGSPENFGGTISDSFTASDGHLYLVQMILNLNVPPVYGGFADFSNTSTFRFTDLGSSSLQSASGTFLSAQDTNVPEPGTWMLCAAGIFGLAITRSRVRRS